MRKLKIKSPAEKLTENQIDIAQATLDAESNGLVQALGIGGSLMQNLGSTFLTSGLSKTNASEGLTKTASYLEPLMGLLTGVNQVFANGGIAGGVPIEVEGEEVAETPMGAKVKFKGPKHNKGGIKTSVPAGTKIYSDRIQVEDKTMAERKQARDRKEKKFSRNDSIDKNTLKRVKLSNELEEEEDMYIQQVMDFFQKQGLTGRKKYATGTGKNGVQPDPKALKDLLKKIGAPTLKGLGLPNLSTTQSTLNPFESEGITGGVGYTPTLATPPINGDTQESFQNNPLIATLGDMLGIGGNIFQGVAAYRNTLNSRATDTPNINAFEGFGLDALETNARAQNLSGQIRDKQLADLEDQRAASLTRNRQGARSINTMRALDTASSIAANKAESDIMANYTNQLMSLLGQESQLENMRDNAVMQGEYQRDLADRQDKDAYYTNLGANLTDLGRITSATGKTLNDMKARDVQAELLNQLFDYVGFDPSTGTIKGKKVKLTNKKK